MIAMEMERRRSARAMPYSAALAAVVAHDPLVKVASAGL